VIQPSDVFIDRRRFWVRLPDGERRQLETGVIRYFHQLGQHDADKRGETLHAAGAP
jgi:hypothetical protein